MRGITPITLVMLVTACAHVRAAGVTDIARPPGEQCRTAIAAAERAQNIPPHLLAAIGRVESGRRDPQTGQWASWPWTIDVDGQGAFLPTEQAAIEVVHMLQEQGVLSIDVGCVQINLWYHPDAFANLRQAFDPERNATYGARFLKALFRQTQDWGIAAGLYHSAIATLAGDYRRKVMAVWTGGAVEQATTDPTEALARAWAATLDDPLGAGMTPGPAARSLPVAVTSPASRRARLSVLQAWGLSVREQRSSRD